MGGSRLLISIPKTVLTRQRQHPLPRHPLCAPAASGPGEPPDPQPPCTVHGHTSLEPHSARHHLLAAPGLLLVAPPPTSHSASVLQLRLQQPLARWHHPRTPMLLSPQGSGSRAPRANSGFPPLEMRPLGLEESLLLLQPSCLFPPHPSSRLPEPLETGTLGVVCRLL